MGYDDLINEFNELISKNSKDVNILILKNIIEISSDILNTNSFDLIGEIKLEITNNDIEKKLLKKVEKKKVNKEYDMANFPNCLVDINLIIEHIKNQKDPNRKKTFGNDLNVDNESHKEFYRMFFTNYAKILKR